TLIPCQRIHFDSRCARYNRRASSQLSPNLCSCRPVAMWGCPPACTSGFTRIETEGTTPPRRTLREDSSNKTSSSASDSILKSRIPLLLSLLLLPLFLRARVGTDG